MLQNPKLSDYELDEQAAEALALLNSPVLLQAFADLERDCIDAIRTSLIGSEQANSSQAMLQAISALRAKLTNVVNTQKMRHHRERKNV